MTFVSYMIGDEDWRAENGDGLCADFEIAAGEIESELPRWHGALSGEPEEFARLRRLYGVHPLIGVEKVDDMRAWSAQELATSLGETAADIERRVETAKTFWRRWKLEHPRSVPGSASAAVSNDGGAESKQREARAELSESDMRRLLLEHGFVNVIDPDERTYIANRIRELELWLDSEQSRSATRALIQSEVHLFFMIDRAIAGVKAMINRKTTAEPAQDSTRENEQMMKLLKERQAAVTELHDSMKALGMDEAKGGGLRKKMNFQDTLTTCIEGWQEYYSDHSRALIDRIHTAAEIELLCTPMTLRPVQYRPDVVCAAWEAMQHFWEREWVPTPIGRMAARRLKAGFEEGLKLIRAEANESIAGMGESDEELEEAAEAGATTSAAGTPLPAGDNQPPPMPMPVIREDDLAV